jgi:hypothetical protein
MATFARRMGPFEAAVMRAVQGQVVSAFNDHPEWAEGIPNPERAVAGIAKRVASRIVASWDRLSGVRAAAPAPEGDGGRANADVRPPRLAKRHSDPPSRLARGRSGIREGRNGRRRRDALEVALGILASNLGRALKEAPGPFRRADLEARLSGVVDALRCLAARRGGASLADVAAAHAGAISGLPADSAEAPRAATADGPPGVRATAPAPGG